MCLNEPHGIAFSHGGGGGEDVVKGDQAVFPNQFRDIWYHTSA